VVCRSDADSPLLYHGVLDVSFGPLRGHMPEPVGKLRLPHDLEAVRNAYLLCEYVASCCGAEGKSGIRKVVRRS
jgi:hypothetical protein